MKKLDKLFPSDSDKLALYQNIQQLYIVENKRRNDVISLLNITDTVFTDACKRAGIVKSKELQTALMKEKQGEALVARRNTMRQRYGVDYAMQSEKLSNKFKDNCIKKYGVDNPFKLKEVQVSQRDTMKKRYGVAYTTQNADLYDKCKSTWLENLGVDNPAKSDEVLQRTRCNNYDKYGVEYPSQLPEVIQKQRDTNFRKFGASSYLSSVEGKARTRAVVLERYGVDNAASSIEVKLKHRRNYRGVDSGEFTDEYTFELLNSPSLLEQYICSLPKEDRNYASMCNRLKVGSETLYQCLKKFELLHLIVNGVRSHAEQSICDYVTSIGVEYSRNIRSVISPCEIDIYISELRIGIEHNGDYYHSSKFVDAFYHINKWKKAADCGVFLYHIFEHEWLHNTDAIRNELSILLNCVPIIESNCCQICKQYESIQLIRRYVTTPVKFEELVDTATLVHLNNIVAVAGIFKSLDHFYMVYSCIDSLVTGGLSVLYNEFSCQYPELRIIVSVGKLDYVKQEAGFKARLKAPNAYYYNTYTEEYTYEPVEHRSQKWVTVYDAGILEYQKEE